MGYWSRPRRRDGADESTSSQAGISAHGPRLERGLQEDDGAAPLLAGHHLGESNAGVVIDGDVDVFPIDAPAVALASAIAGIR